MRARIISISFELRRGVIKDPCSFIAKIIPKEIVSMQKTMTGSQKDDVVIKVSKILTIKN